MRMDYPAEYYDNYHSDQGVPPLLTAGIMYAWGFHLLGKAAKLNSVP